MSEKDGVKLDITDRRILYELDIDSRQKIRDLAKKVKRARSVVEYKMNRLEELGVIRNYVALLDVGALGFMVWNIYVELQNTDRKKEDEINEYVKGNPKVWWAAECSGRWDFIYSVVVKDIKEFYGIVEEFNQRFGTFVLNQAVAAHGEVEVISRGYFLDKAGSSVPWFRAYKPVALDESDKKLLSALSTNARLSLIDLAKLAKLNPKTASTRLKRLEKEVVTVFRLNINQAALGYRFYKIIVYLKDYSKAKDRALIEYCKSISRVFHYERKIGSWMLELEMDCEGYEKCDELMHGMKDKFPDFVRSYEIMLIKKEIKGELDLTKFL